MPRSFFPSLSLRFFPASALLLLSFASTAAFISANIMKHATSPHLNGSALRFVKNSRVCETTPGVEQYSGFVDIGKNQSMWFWFFEARHEPENAPFALWLNGGPGCSSMIGLFQENGPCKVQEDGYTTVLNPYSWNEYANMIYVDQPISVGYSYGTDNVNTTWEAAAPVWEFFQLLFTSGEFQKYQSREFGLWTESYGGHYGPAFAEYFQMQNAKIAEGTITGEKINLMALGINNGWYDSLIQNAACFDFAQEKYNNYLDIVNSTVLAQVNESLYGKGGCKELDETCYRTGTDKDCHAAYKHCLNKVYIPAIGNQDTYYILRNASDPFPSMSYIDFLSNHTIKDQIGVGNLTNYTECPDAPYMQFVPSGDDSRSTLPDLARVVDTGLRTLIWAGDLDYSCNWLGGYRAMEAMQWKHQSQFNNAEWTSLQADGQIWGLYKTAGNLSFVKVFQSGHEVPSYKPQISLELFKQTMKLQDVHSTD